MKKSIKRSFAIVLSLVLVCVMIVPVFGATEVRVFVEYQPNAQSEVQRELQRIGANFHYTFNSLNSFVVSVPENSLNGLRKNSKIVSIEIDPVRAIVPSIPAATGQSILQDQVVPYGVDMVQAREIWDANKDLVIDEGAPTGAGRTVCIIDTGLYTGHEDFVGVNVLGGFSQTNEDTSLWTFDGYGHGTHVAGTVAAANNSYGVVGVTPGKVSLFIVKIFGDDGLWVTKAHASDLIKAANTCAENGANIISMSLSGTDKCGKEKRTFDNLYAAGVLSIAAASNEGISDYHYPASYDSVMSVAAIDENKIVADFSQFNDQVEIAAPGVGVLSTLPFIATAYVEVEGESYNAIQIEYALTGAATGVLADGGLCLTTGDWNGKVVLCERGDISFYEKVMNVQNSGGVAAVIYNNIPDLFSGTLGEGNTSSIVAVSLSQADGQFLVANKIGSIAEVSATIDFPANGYEAWDGTSMATPHVSGVAALIWSWNPSLTNVQIREAIDATALDLGDPGRDVYYGFGLVQAHDALDYLINLSGQ